MTTNRNNIFWHICQLNNWKNIVEDQYKSIIESNLLDTIDGIYINLTGNRPQDIDFLLSNTKIHILRHTNNYNNYERSCLHILLDWSKYNNSNVLYIHTKGVSHSKNNNVWWWRKFLEKVVIFNHLECVSKLEIYDVIGSNLIDEGNSSQKIDKENHCLHFSGNFWWSKTSHIRKLSKIANDVKDLSIDKKYFLCERWIVSNYPECKPYEICSTKRKHFYIVPPPKNIKLILQ